MKKRLFFGFTLFVGIAMVVAWQFAAAELADLQKDVNPVLKGKAVEVAVSPSTDDLFI